MQLPEILYNAHIFDFTALIFGNVEHLPVLGDEVGDEELDHLCCDKERDRYQRIEQLEIANEC